MRKANQARVRWLGSQIHHTTGKLYRVFNNIKNMVMLTPWDFVYGFEPVWASRQVFQLSQAVVDAIVSCMTYGAHKDLVRFFHSLTTHGTRIGRQWTLRARIDRWVGTALSIFRMIVKEKEMMLMFVDGHLARSDNSPINKHTFPTPLFKEGKLYQTER